jgi:malate dehydrogenase (oxaloacetate-decarboxylating)
MIETLDLHSRYKGKLEIKSIYKIDSRDILSKIYTPGVGEICQIIKYDESKISEYTIAGKTVAVISNGTAVLGFGDIGPKAALPVMEGKSAIFKEFADIDSYPICIAEKDPVKLINIVKSIALNFAAINLEDIAAPDCFYIEEKLANELDIPVIHDDQHGTAIVVLAALLGALKLYPIENLKIAVSGAGAAGTAISNLLLHAKDTGLIQIDDFKIFDSKGLVSFDREDLNSYKRKLAVISNQNKFCSFEEGIKNTDVFIGVSVPGSITKENIKSMNMNPFIFALSNPNPEILPEDARSAGASIIATGRSDYPNQVNNALAYPGVFKGLLENRINKVTMDHKLMAAKAIFEYNLKDLNRDRLLPSILDKNVPKIISEYIK